MRFDVPVSTTTGVTIYLLEVTGATEESMIVAVTASVMDFWNQQHVVTSRLDLGKLHFLDKIEDPYVDAALRVSALTIAKAVNEARGT
jgi:hypothetical protein